MNRKKLIVLCVIGLGVAGIWYYLDVVNSGPRIPRQRVFVGDSADRVLKRLGVPSIEFPRGGCLVQWFEGCEVTLSNGVVVDVLMTPIESEDDRMMREMSVQEDEKRLREAYQAVVIQENISYSAWLDREEQRLRDEQLELAKVKAYEKRRAEQKRKADIRAEAIRRARLR